MPDYRRAKFKGGIYFFTLITHHRRPFLTTELARATLRTAWKETQNHHPFQVIALCLLPDHLHCIWRLPENDDDFSTRWQSIKARFTKKYLAAGGTEGTRNDSRKRTGEAAVWQRRFWEHLIEEESDYARHFHYIHYNPVKHGYVSKPVFWQWSTIHRYIRKGIYTANWGDDSEINDITVRFGE